MELLLKLLIPAIPALLIASVATWLIPILPFWPWFVVLYLLGLVAFHDGGSKRPQ